MTSQWTRRAATRVAWCLLATFPLATTSSAVEPIRILVVMPGEPGKLAQQVRQFEDALRTSRGPVGRASSLAEADAVVEFTAYRRMVGDKGKPQDWWYGHYILLQAPSQGARSIQGAKRFTLVVIDREDRQVEPVLELLGTTLGGALGLAPFSKHGKSL